MELKLRCACGQKIAFEAEPVDGRLPFDLQCPACSASLNEPANAEIASHAAAMATSETAAPSETATSHAPSEVTPPAAGSALKLRMAARPEPRHEPAPQPKPFQPAEAGATSGSASKIKIEPIFADPHFGKAILGAVIGAALTVGAWFALYKATEVKWGVMAIAVGWFAGFGARWIGRSEGPKMALAVAGIALAFIIGFQAYRANDEMWGFTRGASLDTMYQEEVEGAKKEISAVPTGSDAEIRAWWTKLAQEDGETMDPNSITAQELKAYRETTWKRQKSLADGTFTKEMYQKELEEGIDEVKQSPVFRIIFWVKALGLFNIIYIVIGVGAAYKFGNGAG